MAVILQISDEWTSGKSDNNQHAIKLTIDATDVDVALEKVNRLCNVLSEANKLMGSLRTGWSYYGDRNQNGFAC